MTRLEVAILIFGTVLVALATAMLFEGPRGSEPGWYDKQTKGNR